MNFGLIDTDFCQYSVVKYLLELLISKHVELDGLLRVDFPHLIRLFDASLGDIFSAHEGDQANDDGVDAPHGVPELGMEVAERHADFSVRLEAARSREHHDTWRLIWVLRRE